MATAKKWISKKLDYEHEIFYRFLSVSRRYWVGQEGMFRVEESLLGGYGH